MGFKLNSVVPWGRSFDEYTLMFSLAEEDFSKRILGCGDGPASFNAEAKKRGLKVTSVDPIYIYSKPELEQRIKEVKEDILSQTQVNQHLFVWDRFTSIEELGRARSDAMNLFLDDFEMGLSESRYIIGSVPELPFEDSTFDLCLVSHFLFLYSEHLDLDFHIQAIEEMMRVSKEVRIFPLTQLDATQSPLLDGVIKAVEARYSLSVVNVNYEFQRGADKMLVVKA